jgi:hypothetical protein
MVVNNRPHPSPPTPAPTPSVEIEHFLDLLARLIARWHVRQQAGEDPSVSRTLGSPQPRRAASRGRTKA